MHFRISHLLLATALVAVVCMSLVMPTNSMHSWMRFLVWAIYCAVAIRLLASQGRERIVLLSALLCGLTYLVLVFNVMNGWPLPPSKLLHESFGRFIATGESFDPRERIFRAHGEFAFSYLFAFLGGSLAAHWTRAKK